jgi:hypothetical protein
LSEQRWSLPFCQAALTIFIEISEHHEVLESSSYYFPKAAFVASVMGSTANTSRHKLED